MNLLDNPIFKEADKAREHLEAQRWPNGPVCPHCGNADQARIKELQGKAHRPGLYQCAECRQQFTVTVGTVFERSKIKLNVWLLATYLLCSSKKGMSAHQLHRTIGVTYKTAWFMFHRIREAMRDDAPAAPMGGNGQPVEADETYFGDKDVVTKRTKKGKSGLSSKRAVVALVERGGSVRSFHVDRADKATVTTIVKDNIAKEATLYTDESRLYGEAKNLVKNHDAVKHVVNEYVRGDVHTNTIEGFFSIFKRGMKGVYQHCGEKNLHRYLAEFDFRYNNRIALGITDTMRADTALSQIAGKRLTYRRPYEEARA